MATVGQFGYPKITVDRISGHFRSIRNFLYFYTFLTKWQWPFWMSENHFRSHYWAFQIDMEHFFFEIFDKMGTTMSIIELVRDIWMSNVCVKFEERSLNPSKVISLTTILGRGGCVADENIIFPKICVSREYNYW